MSYAMPHAANAARAYQAGAAHRSLRQQEADVFRRASFVLRSCAQGSGAQGSGAQGSGTDSGGAANPVTRVRALADNRRLWSMVMDLVRDPANQLPVAIRANLVSIGLAVGREMDKAEPDFSFLAEVNEQIAAGLAS